MTEQRTVNKKALAFWLIIGALFGWLLSSLVAPTAAKITIDDSNTNEDTLDLKLYWDVFNEIESVYVDIQEVEDRNQVYGSIKGLVESLDDPHSAFMTPEETKEFNDGLNGELEGIGAELTLRDGKLVIVSPLRNTPAERAGIQPGDHIFLVDDAPTSEMTLFEAIMNIRGEPGTDVILTLIREGETEPFDVTITRQRINVPSVELSFQENNGLTVADLEVSQFGEDTVSEFNKAVQQVLLEEADALILDLRLNGGGFLDASVDMLGEFFDEKMRAVIVKYRNRENEVLYTDGKGRLTEIPVVVLINEGSASASEIMAGALQDHERATIVGEQSFGKGSVQELKALKDGSSLRLTIAKWFTPLDRSIDEVGVTPDQVIEMEPSEVNSENDIQFEAALNLLTE